MMGDSGLLQPQEFGQLTHAPLAGAEQADNLQPAFVGHDFEELEQQLKLFVGHGSLSISMYI